MKLQLFGIKACDTCKKAIKALSAEHEVEFVDVRDTPLPKDQLTSFYDAFGDALVNTRSTTWRNLSEAERARAQLELLADNPTLMKRPVIIGNAQPTLGWAKDVQDQYLSAI